MLALAFVVETQGQPARAAMWSDFVDGTRPFIAIALFFWLVWTWEARWGGLVLAQGGAGLAAVWVLSRQGWLGRPPSLASLREPLRFSLPMILAMLAYVGYQSADRLYVALWGGVAAAGRAFRPRHGSYSSSPCCHWSRCTRQSWQNRIAHPRCHCLDSHPRRRFGFMLAVTMLVVWRRRATE